MPWQSERQAEAHTNVRQSSFLSYLSLTIPLRLAREQVCWMSCGIKEWNKFYLLMLSWHNILSFMRLHPQETTHRLVLVCWFSVCCYGKCFVVTKCLLLRLAMPVCETTLALDEKNERNLVLGFNAQLPHCLKWRFTTNHTSWNATQLRTREENLKNSNNSSMNCHNNHLRGDDNTLKDETEHPQFNSSVFILFQSQNTFISTFSLKHRNCIK